MVHFSLAFLAAAFAAAAPTSSSSSFKWCQSFDVPVTVSARNGRFNIKPPKNDIEVTDFVFNFGQRGANYSQELLTEMYTVQGTYDISATYCRPSIVRPSDTLQILTHGVGFDRSYWDFPFDKFKYSYVNQALANGYSTFSYDRFGIGKSDKGDPINVVQSWLEIAILEKLTEMLRNGQVRDVNTRFKKIVHVGHSFGSIQSYALSVDRPELSDGLILTGFSHVPDYMPWFLFGANFVATKSRDYPAGYITPDSTTAVNQNFLAPNNFDPRILDEAFKKGQPATLGEFLTLGAPASTPSKFTGPVLVITGDYDIPFCGGKCMTPTGSLLDASASMFSQSSHFETYVVPKTGHGMNFELSFQDTYDKINVFLGAQIKV